MYIHWLFLLATHGGVLIYLKSLGAKWVVYYVAKAGYFVYVKSARITLEYFVHDEFSRLC